MRGNVKVYSDDEIRVRGTIEVPAGVSINSEEIDGGRTVRVEIGGWAGDGPRITLLMSPAAAKDLHRELCGTLAADQAGE